MQATSEGRVRNRVLRLSITCQMSCGALLLSLLSFFLLSCPGRMQGVKPVLVKVTGEVHNIFWEKKEDKQIV